MKGVNTIVYNYIRDYFQKNFPEYYLIFKEDGLKDEKDGLEYVEDKYLGIVQKQICNKYEQEDIKNGNVDEEIYKVLTDYVNDYFTESQRKDCALLYEYVRNMLLKQESKSNFSDDIFDHVVKLVVARVWPQYDKSRLNTNDFDHVIKLIYNNVYNRLEKQISDKVKKIIDIKKIKNVGLGAISLEESVVNSILINEERGFLVKLGSLKIESDKELSRTALDVVKYIENYVRPVSEENIKSVVDVSDKVDVQEEVQSNGEVNYNKTNMKNNLDIKFNREMMKNNSVQKDGVPKKRKSNKKQIKINKTVVLLALLGVLVGVGVAVNDYNKEQNDMYAIMRFDTLDTFNYSRTWGRDDKYYNDMADNIISLYSKLEQLPNENHETVGLYKAYDGCVRVSGKDEGLLEMESFFSLMKRKMVQEDIEMELRNVIKADSKEEYFYLDFVYDTLHRAGNEEVKSEKYQNLLFKYKYANFGNHYGVVGVMLTDEEKQLLSDIMTKYVEYYKQAKKDIGYMIASGEYSFFSTYTGTTGKGM